MYLLTGAALLILILLPTKGKISSKTQKALYLGVIIWIICFAYRVNTGNDIAHLFISSDDFGNKQNSTKVKGSPFNKYYSNDAGRKPKN
jgi:hypothetical protein